MATVATDSVERTTPPHADPWRIAWNLIASDILLASLLLALAALLTLTALLPQSPDSSADPMAFSRWQAEAQARLGTLFMPLRETGLLAFASSPLPRGLIAVIALCLLLRTVDALLATAHSRRFQPPPSPLPSQVSVEQPLDNVVASLHKRFRIIREGDVAYADHFPLAHIGRLAVYLGALLLILSLSFSSVAGWRSNTLNVGIGQMVPLNEPRQSPYNLRLDALDSSQRGRVSLLKESEPAGTGYLAVHRPLELAGLTITLDGTGPAIRASATLSDGQPIRLQSSAASAPTNDLLLLLTQDEPDRYFAVPDAELVVRLSRGTQTPDRVHAQIYRSRTGTLLFDDAISPNGQIKIENVNLALAAEPYATIRAVRDPGKLILLIGMTILALGLMLSTLWPSVQVWLTANLNETQIAGEADAVQAIAAALSPSTQRSRLQGVVASVGWRVGFALLSAIAGAVVTFALQRGELVWPLPVEIQFCVAAWLAGCAALLSKSPVRWVTLALTAIVAVIVAGQAARVTLGR
jgi:hypothetical protein